MSKYQMIVEWVRRKIEIGEFAANEKLPSEYELVEQFGVSRQTVRKAIEILEASGDVKSQQGSGTFVMDKTKPVLNNCKRVAVVTTYVDNYIFPKIIQGIEKILNKEGYHMQISFTNNRGSREEGILRDLLQQDLGGIIIETTKSALPNPNLDLYRKLQSRNIPIIFLHSKYRGLDIPTIGLDDDKAGRTMVQYLVDQGHTKIGGLFKLDDGQGMMRYQGYISQLLENNLKVRGNHVVWVDTEDVKHIEMSEEKIMARFRDCTGVVCYNDQLAYNLIDILKRHEIRVPEEISVISVDNIETSLMGETKLTSVNHPKEELGQKAAELLVQMMTTGEICDSYTFEGELVVRESVKECEVLPCQE